MDLIHELAREYIAAKYPQHLPEFDEYMALSALDQDEQEVPLGADKFAGLELLEAMLGSFALGVISGYFGNLLFHYFGPNRFTEKRKSVQIDVAELCRKMKDAGIRNRALQRMKKTFSHEDLVEEIVLFVESRLIEKYSEEQGGQARLSMIEECNNDSALSLEEVDQRRTHEGQEKNTAESSLAEEGNDNRKTSLGRIDQMSRDHSKIT